MFIQQVVFILNYIYNYARCHSTQLHYYCIHSSMYVYCCKVPLHSLYVMLYSLMATYVLL
jgi:hypothetical protein